MFFCGCSTFKRVGAIACVILTCFVGIQGVVASIDRFEHAVGIEHAADSLAGTVISCVEAPQLCSPASDVHPGSHAHVGDTFTAITAAHAAFIEGPIGAHAPSSSRNAVTAGITLAALERPPKA